MEKIYLSSLQMQIPRPFLQFDDDVAVVEYTPNGTDNGKYLRCRGVNPHLTDQAVEDQWKISVHGRHQHFVV